jgi:acyl-CoA synthetase (AMP-forming)/AMP-acid ligase II
LTALSETENTVSVGVLVGAESYSWEELDGRANAAARRLTALGVQRGDRVAVMLTNRIEFTIVVHGVMKLGAAAVLLSTAWKAAEVELAESLTTPVLRLTDAVVDELDLDGDGSPLDVAPPAPTDESVLVFSSGTTGLPKAVRHTHASLTVATEHWATGLGLGPDDVFQIATPPAHILGLLNLLAAEHAGATVRLHARFDLDEVLRCIERDGVTLEMAVAPIALAMANHPDLERFDLSSLRYLMWCATPVTESVARRITERTGVPVITAYGASELPVLACTPADRPEAWRLDAAGIPPAGVELRVGDDGELQARSPSVMAGYLPEDADADAFTDDGWYRTGDVGWIEPDGWVHITDRCKEMIKVNGFQVAPAELEAVLLGHPGVLDCAVFGVPDDAKGEVPVAAVCGSADVSPDELRQLVADTLATYKQLQRVVLVDAIPRLPSGKVLRRVLRDEHA